MRIVGVYIVLYNSKKKEKKTITTFILPFEFQNQISYPHPLNSQNHAYFVFDLVWNGFEGRFIIFLVKNQLILDKIFKP